jgi:hypothetical protein
MSYYWRLHQIIVVSYSYTERLLSSNDVSSKTSVVVNVVVQCKNKIRLLSSNDVSSKTSVVENVVVQCKNKIRLLSSNDVSSKTSFVVNDCLHWTTTVTTTDVLLLTSLLDNSRI